MPAVPTGYAFNRSRQAYLATEVAVADTHWTRLRGLMGTPAASFRSGQGLWIVPCHGVHTFAMRFPIDVVYLDQAKTIVHLEKSLQPWRIAPIRRKSVSVLELPPDTLSTTGTVIGDELEITLGSRTGGPS
ncbi:MAG TPA: DUF192 domain-containing protein [Terriglobales bacterium]|nr:DUF192 domain-containing protein [Terriglobales bacterium]